MLAACGFTRTLSRKRLTSLLLQQYIQHALRHSGIAEHTLQVDFDDALAGPHPDLSAYSPPPLSP